MFHGKRFTWINKCRHLTWFMLSSLERQVGKMFWLPGIKRNDIEEAEIVAAATGTSA